MARLTEKRLVRLATPRIMDTLRLRDRECSVAHELAIGYSIADIVILRASSTSCFWPERPLSVAESAILSSLRRLGSASVEAVAKAVFMQAEPVRRLLLGRLSSWYLVRRTRDEFRPAKAWVSRSEIVAVEAKLTRWREALAQAAVYCRYADRAFVLLPSASALVAAQHKDEFAEAGVGLLSYNDGNVVRVFSSPRATEHSWHREFAISRIR